MRLLGWVALAVVLVVGYCHDARQRGAITIAERRAKDSDVATGVWKAKYAEASAEADRVDTIWQRQVARVDSIKVPLLIETHDSVVAMPPGYALIDTAKFREYVTSREDALTTCAQVMLGFRAFRGVADSALAATAVSRDAWRMLAIARRPSWKQRVGVYAGVDYRGRPTFGIGVKLWPKS